MSGHRRMQKPPIQNHSVSFMLVNGWAGYGSMP
jgi:hypothetical protein